MAWRFAGNHSRRGWEAQIQRLRANLPALKSGRGLLQSKTSGDSLVNVVAKRLGVRQSSGAFVVVTESHSGQSQCFGLLYPAVQCPAQLRLLSGAGPKPNTAPQATRTATQRHR